MTKLGELEDLISRVADGITSKTQAMEWLDGHYGAPTWRDEVAARMAQGMVADPAIVFPVSRPERKAEFAELAYDLAEALIAEGKRRSEEVG